MTFGPVDFGSTCPSCTKTNSRPGRSSTPCVPKYRKFFSCISPPVRSADMAVDPKKRMMKLLRSRMRKEGSVFFCANEIELSETLFCSSSLALSLEQGSLDDFRQLPRSSATERRLYSVLIASRLLEGPNWNSHALLQSSEVQWASSFNKGHALYSGEIGKALRIEWFFGGVRLEERGIV